MRIYDEGGARERQTCQSGYFHRNGHQSDMDVTTCEFTSLGSSFNGEGTLSFREQ